MEEAKLSASRKLEEGKLKAARQDVLNKEISIRMVQLTANLASAIHSMAWLTWSSNRDVLTQKKVSILTILRCIQFFENFR